MVRASVRTRESQCLSTESLDNEIQYLVGTKSFSHSTNELNPVTSD